MKGKAAIITGGERGRPTSQALTDLKQRRLWDRSCRCADVRARGCERHHRLPSRGGRGVRSTLLDSSLFADSSSSAQRTKKSIEADGQDCLTLPLDLMKAENCQRVVDEHIKKYGSLDVLVNNASKQIMSDSIESIDVSPPSGKFACDLALKPGSQLDNVESTFRSNILAMFALTKWVLFLFFC